MSVSDITAPVPISRCRLLDDTDRGQGRGPDDDQPRGPRRSVVELHGVPDVLVQLGKGRWRPGPLLWTCRVRVRRAREARPARRGVVPSTGTTRPSMLKVVERRRRPRPRRRDHGSRSCAVWGCGTFGDAAIRSQELVAPVPPVERRMRDERVETRAEDHCGDEHDDGQHRAERRRPQRNRASSRPGSRAKRIPATARHGQVRRKLRQSRCATRAACDAACGGPSGAAPAGRRVPIATPVRQRRSRRAIPQPSTVQSNAIPPDRVHAPNRTERRERRQRAAATATASRAPATIAPMTPINPSADRHRRARLPTRGKASSSSPPARSWRPIAWPAMRSAASAGDGAEHAERDGHGVRPPARQWPRPRS